MIETVTVTVSTSNTVCACKSFRAIFGNFPAEAGSEVLLSAGLARHLKFFRIESFEKLLASSAGWR
jgi:hypothetical protein